MNEAFSKHQIIENQDKHTVVVRAYLPAPYNQIEFVARVPIPEDKPSTFELIESGRQLVKLLFWNKVSDRRIIKNLVTIDD